MEYKLYQGDCLEEMSSIEDNSIDLILTDLPYGEVNQKSVAIPLDTDDYEGDSDIPF